MSVTTCQSNQTTATRSSWHGLHSLDFKTLLKYNSHKYQGDNHGRTLISESVCISVSLSVFVSVFERLCCFEGSDFGVCLLASQAVGHISRGWGISYKGRITIGYVLNHLTVDVSLHSAL